jgi:Fic family protein
MVKTPKKPPDWKDFFLKNDLNKIFNFAKRPEIMQLVEKTDRLYYDWEKIISQPLPKEFNKDEVWIYLRLRRSMKSRVSPVQDVKNKPFTFWLTDDIQKNLHLIDQSTGGNLALWDPAHDMNASTKFMISSLMEEAITSSQIEGAVATIKHAKKMLLEKRKPENKSEKMIYNNYITMQSLKEHCKKKLTIELLQELHSLITKDTLETHEEGRFRRTEDNVSVVTSEGEILFVPPPAEEISQRLEGLISFANEINDKPFIHPIIKAIILHFWLAYIHPFVDGNGRLARTLFYWYVLKHEYWLFEYTSISKTILKRTTQYANAYLFTEHDDNDLTYFIHFHIYVIKDAVDELKKHIQSEREKNQKAIFEISQNPDLNIRQTRILQHIRSHPSEIITIKAHQNMNGITYQTARTDLLKLEEKGWLKLVKKGKTFYFTPSRKNYMS